MSEESDKAREQRQQQQQQQQREEQQRQQQQRKRRPQSEEDAYGPLHEHLRSMVDESSSILQDRPIMQKAVAAKEGDCLDPEHFLNQVREAHVGLGNAINRLAQNAYDHEGHGQLSSHTAHLLASVSALKHTAAVKDRENKAAQEKAR